MSRKRDTNWTRDEITVLLDSIMEITRTRAEDGRRTNSREVFEFAAKQMGEKGHSSRAEREKCRTKWKKMKEEFTHAKRAREGDTRYKEAPGIQPFYERMEEFINGNFDNISPHSTIVRRSSSISSSNNTNSSSSNAKPSLASRASARIAANNTNGAPPNDTTNNEASGTTSAAAPKTITNESDYSSTTQTPSSSSPSSRQTSRLSSGSTNSLNNNLYPLATAATTATMTMATTTTSNSPVITPNHNHHQQQAIPNGELCTIFSSYNGNTSLNNSTRSNFTGHNNNNSNNNNNSSKNMSSSNNSNILNSTGNDSMNQLHPADHADISYRVSTGCRQITIFGDHDVDIKFRGDCVTINKICADHSATTET